MIIGMVTNMGLDIRPSTKESRARMYSAAVLFATYLE
jgi:hypothetical protein